MRCCILIFSVCSDVSVRTTVCMSCLPKNEKQMRQFVCFVNTTRSLFSLSLSSLFFLFFIWQVQNAAAAAAVAAVKLENFFPSWSCQALSVSQSDSCFLGDRYSRSNAANMAMMIQFVVISKSQLDCYPLSSRFSPSSLVWQMSVWTPKFAAILLLCTMSRVNYMSYVWHYMSHYYHFQRRKILARVHSNSTRRVCLWDNYSFFV